MTDEHAPLVWCDIETTGLELSWDQLLEVAVVITDSDLDIKATYSSVLHWPELVSMRPVVYEMHTKSGLRDEVLDEGKPIWKIQTEIIRVFERTGVTGDSLMAGSTVHFDRAFMKRDFPAIVSRLHHRIIDVSTLKELIRRWAPEASPWQKADEHRALPDILDSIRELQYYRRILNLSGGGE